ncbi:MAG: SDR family NAD(P)-dependent oxidoreductase [Bdellovibrionota bacterium]
MSQTSLKILGNNEGVSEGYFSGRVSFQFEKYTGAQQSGVAFLFAGQGSVYPGMFKEAYEEFEAVRRTFAKADAIAKELNLPPISAYTLNPEALSEEDRYAIQNICLFTAEVGLFEALLEKGVKARAVTAHSFGEYAALVASGTATFEEIFRFVCFREKHSPPKNERGFLIAVNGNPKQIESWLSGHKYHISNINSESQTVIAVAPNDAEGILQKLEAQQIRRKQLPTPQPYHSPLLSDMPAKLEAYLQKSPVTARAVHTPLVSSVTHTWHESLTSDQLKQLLTRQMVDPVHFTAQLQTLRDKGCSQYLEIGPSVVLSAFVEATLGEKAVPVDFYTRLSRKKKQTHTGAQKSKLWGTVNKIISQVTGYAIEDISLEDKFQEDLGIDSIKKTEIIFSVLDEVKGDPNQALDTSRVQQVQDLIQFVDGLQNAPVSASRSFRFERYVPVWTASPLLPTREVSRDLKVIELPTSLPTALTKKAASQILGDLRRSSHLAYALVVPDTFSDNIQTLLSDFLAPGANLLRETLKRHLGTFDCNVFLVHTGNPVAAGIAAFFKSLKKEYPEFYFRNIQFEKLPTDLKPVLQAELSDPVGTDVFYRENARYVRNLENHPLNSTSHSPKGLLAIGGAKGITFSLVERVLAATPCPVFIWGRSPESDNAENLRKLRALHPSVEYHQVDATQRSECESALKAHYAKCPELDTIYNGAGVERSQRFADKTNETLVEEIATKTLPLQNLLEFRRPSTAIYHFSSVVSEYGNKGQTLYAWANAWANATIERLGADSRCTAIAWPPWDKVGMTAKQGISNALKSQGVAMLGPDDAFKLLKQEDAASGNPTVFYCDAGDPAAYSSGLLDFTSFAFLGNPNANTRGFGRALNYQSDPYLADHEIGGEAYLPGAVGLSGFLALARLQGAQAIKNVRFSQPISVGREASVGIEWEGTPGGEWILRTKRPHFSAEIDFSTASAPQWTLPAADREMDPKSLYGKGALFHGPAFQGIAELKGHGTEGVSVKFSEKLIPILDKAWYGRLAQWADLVFQATALFGLAEHTALYLPVAVRRTHWHRPVASNSVGARIQFLSHSTDSLVANATLEDASGTFLTLEGIQLGKRENVEKHQLKIRPLKR